MENMVNSGFDRATVGNRFYINRMEVLHKLQKNFIFFYRICVVTKATHVLLIRNCISGQIRATEKLLTLYTVMENTD